MTDQGSAPTGAMKPCPMCKEPVAADAVKCPHCREFIDGRPAPAPSDAVPQVGTARRVIGLVMVLAGALVIAGGVSLIGVGFADRGRPNAVLLVWGLGLLVAGVVLAFVGGVVRGSMRTKTAGTSLPALLVLLGIAGWWGYRMLPQESKDVVNRVASVTGVTITPWIDRAEAAMRAMLASAEQRSVVAKSALAQTNPTGQNPKMGRYEVAKSGETLTTTLELQWTGALLGTDYQTIIEWRCNERGHIQARVTSENCPARQDEASSKALDDYFRTVVWPVLYTNTGGK